MGPRNQELDKGPDPPCKGAIFRVAHCKVWGHFAMSCAKTAEHIDMSFGLWTRVDPKKRALDGGTNWRNLANTTEPSMCGGDVAFFVQLL